MSRADQFSGWLHSVLRDFAESFTHYFEAGGDIWGAGEGWAFIAFLFVALFWAFMLEWANQYDEQIIYQAFGLESQTTGVRHGKLNPLA